MAERLHLRAETLDDLPPLSALVQDMAVRAGDIHWDARTRRLALIGNRYRHEQKQPTRIRSALRLDFVEHVQRRAWPASPDQILVLLAVKADSEWLELLFGGNISLRAKAECIDLTLEDVSGPWGTKIKPAHPGAL
ncbi:MAG: DUF2948 family protein [Sphingomonadaceae bacterium]